MKIPVVSRPLREVLAQKPPAHRHPKRPNLFFRTLLKVLSAGELKATRFTHTVQGEPWDKHTPMLVLMNHSCFLDLKIAASLFYPAPLNIVCTSDGFVGKDRLMRALGCIPTSKFVTDPTLVRDIRYALHNNRTSVLMYPEASYSFDGTVTPLPDTIGRLIKLLNVPVLMLRTHGAFLHDPLYNGLQLRNVSVSCESRLLVTADQAASLSADALQRLVEEAFTFDAFAEQRTEGRLVKEPFRADGLNRVLYRCPHCEAEGRTVGKGVHLTCAACGATYELTEDGRLARTDGPGAFDSVPDWYAWERQTVRQELLDGRYRLDVPVVIRVMIDHKALYEVGEGRLVHTVDGFHLTGCDGQLNYTQSPARSYGLYADYFWYELGDMICIGDTRASYYCFPIVPGDFVAKTRLAAEELYRLQHRRDKIT